MLREVRQNTKQCLLCNLSKVLNQVHHEHSLGFHFKHPV